MTPSPRRSVVPVVSKLPGIGILHSVTTRIVLLTLAVLGAVGLVATIGLAQREREQLVSAKAMAVTMTTELFAASVSAAVDLGDERDVTDRMEPLRSNRAMMYAAVWKTQPNQPVGELGQRPSGPSVFGVPGTTRRGDYLTVVRPVLGPTSSVIGHVGVQVSLEPENQAFRSLRFRFATGALLTGAVTLALLVAVLRWGVVRRLHVIGQAALKLQAGQNVRAHLSGRDELGQLGTAFNTMAGAIEERERRLANARKRLQTLLDHIGQAIITFDVNRTVLGDRSRQAEQLLGPALKDGASIVSLLYSVERGQVVEAESFSTWIDAAFENAGADWAEINELAPRNVTLTQDDGQLIELDLEFRWVARDAEPSFIMMIATDATQRKRLERVMAQAEIDHKKAVAALRWLVAGGGQLFVRFLETARHRLSDALSNVQKADAFDAITIDRVFRDVHTIRAEARCFDLDPLEKALTEVETQLAEVRSGALREPQVVAESRVTMGHWLQTALSSLDDAEQQFVASSPVGREVLDQMTVRRSDVERLVVLTTGRRDEIAKVAQAMTARPFGESIVTLIDAAPRWAERVGKSVQIDVQGAERSIPGRLAERLPGILSHLVRNAIAHGIELCSVRLEAGKSAVGLIRLSCEGSVESPIIRVEDDGKGLDIERRSGSERVRDLETLLEPGVTTYERPSDLAGYGVGLDAVRSDLAVLNYDVEITQGQAMGACFVLSPRHPRVTV